ncbi:MAG: hypothetical protein ACLFQ5_08085 [Oceanicaulis sp.]
MAYGSNSGGYARNAGKRWRREDVAALRAMARRGAPLRLISLRLGRPDAAIRSKASDLGLSVNQGEPVVAPPPSRTLSRNRLRGPITEPRIDARQLELFGAA